MCGIIGYAGTRDVVPVLIGGLKKLEYRGYDSAGIAVIDSAGAGRHRSGFAAAASVEETDSATVIAVRVAVARLPQRQRTALVLRYFADLSVAETAEAMRCPEGTVKTLTRQAILALRSTGLIGDAGIEEESMADVE